MCIEDDAQISQPSARNPTRQGNLYTEPSDQLVKNSGRQLTSMNLRRLNTRAQVVRSQSRGRSTRLDKLRNKYQYLLQQDQQLANQGILIEEGDKVKIKQESDKGSQVATERKEEEVQGDEVKDQETDKPEDKQVEEDTDLDSKDSKYQQIMKELEEERQKRKELESVVQELLSRSGMSKDIYSKGSKSLSIDKDS